jgi:hypothetical protein
MQNSIISAPDSEVSESYDSIPFGNFELLPPGRSSIPFSKHSNSQSQLSRSRASAHSRNSISFNTKEVIANMYRNFAAKRDDDRMLHSITPVSSLEESDYSDASSTINFT